MKKNRIRLTELELHKVINESVYKVLNEISCGGVSKQRNPYDNWDGGFGDNWSDEQWSEYEKKRAEKYKDMPDRDYFNESKGFANKEQSKMMDWKKKRTDVFYDKEGKPISKKYTPRDKDGIPKPIKVRESQLHQIVKESVEQIMNEAYSDAQYAHLAGQAHGALNSFGGRLKGIFNPKWKERKERQMRQFANQAVGDNYGYRNSSTKGGDYNGGSASYRMPNHNYTWSNGGQADYIDNSFNQKNRKSPFEMKRNQSYITVDDPSNPFSKRSYRTMANDGDVYSSDETRSIANQHADNKEWDKYDEMTNLKDSNSMLNRAFRQGQRARKGEIYRTHGGETYTNGTGTSSGAFKRLK